MDYNSVGENNENNNNDNTYNNNSFNLATSLQNHLLNANSLNFCLSNSTPSSITSSPSLQNQLRGNGKFKNRLFLC